MRLTSHLEARGLQILGVNRYEAAEFLFPSATQQFFEAVCGSAGSPHISVLLLEKGSL